VDISLFQRKGPTLTYCMLFMGAIAFHRVVVLAVLLLAMAAFLLHLDLSLVAMSTNARNQPNAGKAQTETRPLPHFSSSLSHHNTLLLEVAI